MKILITGGLGFVGVNLTHALAAQGRGAVIAADVQQVDAAITRFLAPVWDRVDVVRLDVTNRVAVRDLIASQGVTHVVHAAALTPTAEQERTDVTRITDVNLGGTVNLLDAAMNCDCVQRVLVMSSSGVYGAPEDTSATRQREDGPLTLDNLYSITKYSAELLTTRYAALSGKPMAAVRLGPIYGPLERPSKSRQRMSQCGQLLDALRHKRAVKVAEPTIRRDWTYAGDAADAVCSLLTAPRWQYDVYNVSCGVSFTFQQVVAAFVAQGLSASWVDDVARADIAMVPAQERLPIDISRLEEDTSFTPRYNIMQGIAACIAREL